MNDRAEEHASKAISEFFGAVTAGLAEYAKGLPPGLSKEERRGLLQEEAGRQGLTAAALLGLSFEGWEKENARETLHTFIDQRFAGHEDMNGRELAERVFAWLAFDSYFLDLVEAYARSKDGTPPDIGEPRGLGGAFTLNWKGKKLPVVFAFATRYSPRKLVVKQFDDAILRRFGRFGQPTPQTLAAVGWYLRRRAQGRTHRQAAAEHAQAEFQGTAEWADKKKRRRAITVAGNMLRRSKNRFLKYGTKKL